MAYLPRLGDGEIHGEPVTLRESNMAMENPPFMDDFPVLSFHDLSTSMRRMYARALTIFKLGIERLFHGLGGIL